MPITSVRNPGKRLGMEGQPMAGPGDWQRACRKYSTGSLNRRCCATAAEKGGPGSGSGFGTLANNNYRYGGVLLGAKLSKHDDAIADLTPLATVAIHPMAEFSASSGCFALIDMLAFPKMVAKWFRPTPSKSIATDRVCLFRTAVAPVESDFDAEPFIGYRKDL